MRHQPFAIDEPLSSKRSRAFRRIGFGQIEPARCGEKVSGSRATDFATWPSGSLLV
jgi:hypothetical protein